MGCSSSVGQRKVLLPHPTHGPDPIDYTLGFNAKASVMYGLGAGLGGTAFDEDRGDREESDEFRVFRVSSLSGQVTLYVAGGKHKKPVQYASDRLCPRAEEQPAGCPRCPFCPGNEGRTPPSVLEFDEEGREQPVVQAGRWHVRVFPNIFPMLICPLALYSSAHNEALAAIPHSVVAEGRHANNKVRRDMDNPTHQQVDAIGASEVVVESTMHNALLALQEPSKIRVLLEALVMRGRVLAAHPWAKQLLIFKQYGPLSGGSLVHPHTQVVSLPLLPPQLLSRLEYCLYAFSAHGRCATCLSCVDPFLRGRKFPDITSTNSTNTLIRKGSSGAKCMLSPGSFGKPATPQLDPGPITPPPEPPGVPRPGPDEDNARSRLVHVTDHFVVSVPYASSSAYGMTIAPRRHCAHFLQATPEELTDLADILALLAQALYYGLDDPSYNIYIRTAPSVEQLRVRGREVKADEISGCYHWIIEFRPRFPADLGGFEIASGVRVVSGLPEDHAAELRGWIKERLEADLKPVIPNSGSGHGERSASRHPSKNSHSDRTTPRLSVALGAALRGEGKHGSKTAWGPPERDSQRSRKSA